MYIWSAYIQVRRLFLGEKIASSPGHPMFFIFRIWVGIEATIPHDHLVTVKGLGCPILLTTAIKFYSWTFYSVILYSLYIIIRLAMEVTGTLTFYNTWLQKWRTEEFQRISSRSWWQRTHRPGWHLNSYYVSISCLSSSQCMHAVL